MQCRVVNQVKGEFERIFFLFVRERFQIPVVCLQKVSLSGSSECTQLLNVEFHHYFVNIRQRVDILQR